jgi:hypothetical protein
MAYTTIDDPSAYFQTKLYTGNSAADDANLTTSQALTFDGNSDMQPDLLWFKRRDGADHHLWFDVIRGRTKGYYSNLTQGEDNLANSITSFDSDGFTLGNDTGTGGTINKNSETYVAWGWKAGTAFSNDASGTSIGNTDSAGSVNDAAGFSIVGYTGAGSSTDIEIKHGLSTVPQVIITKNRDDANHWAVFHHKNTSAPQTDFLKLSANTATTDDADIWNDTAPTSAIFTAGDHSSSNRAGDPFIAYCFSEKQGYSKFGSYTGNGSTNGSFAYLGFKPAWIMIKSAAAGVWRMWDNKRAIFNPNRKNFQAQSNGAEYSDAAIDIDFISNGFKTRSTDSSYNGSGVAYVYLAFAENPLVTSTGIPGLAK